MIVITEKDYERAKGFFKMSPAQMDAAINRTKSVDKLLARGIAFNQLLNYSYSNIRYCNADAIRRRDNFYLAAKENGATKTQLDEYVISVQTIRQLNAVKSGK